jgi:hypothetical protein
MRLINADTFHFEEFIGVSIPPYAILSHRWETDEVSFAEFETEAGRLKKGFNKIRKTCEQAIKDGLHYV